jgi:hypothetical protein
VITRSARGLSKIQKQPVLVRNRPIQIVTSDEMKKRKYDLVHWMMLFGFTYLMVSDWFFVSPNNPTPVGYVALMLMTIFVIIYLNLGLSMVKGVNPVSLPFAVGTFFMFELKVIMRYLRDSTFWFLIASLITLVITWVYLLVKHEVVKGTRLSRNQRILWRRSFQRLTLLLSGVLLIIFICFKQSVPDFNGEIDLDHLSFPDGASRSELIEYSISSLNGLVERTYSDLNLSERIELAQRVEYIEAKLEGRPAMTVKSCRLPQGISGSFSPAKRVICLDEDLLNDSNSIQLLLTILHEGRHATQFYWIKAINWSDPGVSQLAIFSDMVIIRYEFEHYIDVVESGVRLEDYQNQLIEIDAEYHAVSTLPIYAKSIPGIEVPFLGKENQNLSMDKEDH